MNKKPYVPALIAIGILFSGCSGHKEDIDSHIYSEIKSVNKLVLSQMTISKMATLDDLKMDEAKGPEQTLEAIGNALKVGTRKGAYSYDTYMQAYIDMSSLSPDDIQTHGNTVTILLPPVQTEFAGRDVTINEEHYRVTGLRSAIKPTERAVVKEKISDALKKEVEKNPEFRNQLISTAENKARSYFTSLLTEEDGIENVIIEFK